MRIQIMRKLMIVMTDLVLLILVGVQAINLASTSFAPLFTSNLVSILLSNWSCKNKVSTLPWRRDWRLKICQKIKTQNNWHIVLWRVLKFASSNLSTNMTQCIKRLYVSWIIVATSTWLRSHQSITLVS